MTSRSARIRLAVDIGGTFTDVALAHGAGLTTAKVLTTPSAPDDGVIEGFHSVLEQAGIAPGELELVVHGTTLATNALIERKGARTALVCSEGFRDSVEMAYENRFEQYDIDIDRPPPLVPRHLRLSVGERVSAAGQVLKPLDEDSVRALLPMLERHEIESVAIGLLHSYAAPAHEIRVAEILREARPDLWITLSSEVCPEIREYERQSTACANAYVQPLMARYLRRLETRLREAGLACPFLLMTSGGGLTTLDTAARFPIRLVESGPAGGAILASRIAAECGLDQAVSFDMGGTTAKICLLDDAKPLTARTFEVARVYRFMKGSGLPVRIPVIEMVEIGAGGGSIAQIDALGRIAVGPESAGADPGPACYDRGGTRPTVTDADLVMGRIDPARFAGGTVALKSAAAETAVLSDIGEPQGLGALLGAYGICEMVDENMANAARIHAIEWGKDIAQRTLIAFGGAAPLHAARLAEKLGIERIVVPTGAGVGSAIGFLEAPVAYEVVRSRYQRLSRFEASEANAVLEEMRAEAEAVVRQGAPEGELVETRSAFMRYLGQGHEISVSVPSGVLEQADEAKLLKSFEAAYEQLYGRTIPNLDVEVLSWTLTLAMPVPGPEPNPLSDADAPAAESCGRRTVFDPGLADQVEASLYRREELSPGMDIAGPALIAEAQTTSVVSAAFDATIDAKGYIVMTRRPRSA